MDSFDAVVIGGGAAGLSAALMLGRSRRRVLVVDSGLPRNRVAAHMHGFLTRDGTDPAELLREARIELEQYPVDLVDDEVREVAGECGRFEVTLGRTGVVGARRLIVATGLIDVLPRIPGLTDLWGERLFHCPYCHGWEVRGRALGVIAVDPWAGHGAVMLTQWSDDLTLFGDAALSERDESALEARGARREREAIERVEAAGPDADDGVRIVLADGSVHERDALFVMPRPLPNDELLRSLGCDVIESRIFEGFDFVVVDDSQATTVPGVYAAGNVVDISAQVIHAAAQGARAGGAVNHDLIDDDIEALLIARGR